MSLQKNDLYEFGDFLLNCRERTLWRDSEVVPLAPKALETLCLLVENHGRLMTKDELMNELWADTFVEERNLAQNVFTLRKILGETGRQKFIETVPKRGYRFIAEVRPIGIEQEELIEISLAKHTTIKAEAEGRVSSKELAEAVRETAKSLQLGQNIEEKDIKTIETAEKPRHFSPIFSGPVLMICALFILAVGLGGWFWQNYGAETRKNSFAQNADSDIKLQRLTDSGKAWNPAVSPDGQQIAYVFHVQNKDSIRLQNLASGSIIETVPPDEAADYGRLLFSKDGNYLFYHSREGGKEGNIYQTPIYGGYAKKIVANVRSDFSLSPDGEWFAFFRYDGPTDETRLMICRTDGREEKMVAARKGKLLFRVWEVFPAWSPDGTKLAAAALTQNTDQEGEKGRDYLVEINVSDGSEKQLRAPAFYKILQVVWMPDGNSLIALAQESAETPFQIWQISYPEGKARRLTNDLTNYFRISLAPGGDFLLTNERRTYFNIWTINAENPARSKQLTFNTNVKNGYYGLMWTPDEKQIIYSQTNGVEAGNIWSLDVETQKTTQLTSDEIFLNWFPVVTPDGGSVIFASNRSGNWHLWQMRTDGSELRQITDGIGESFPQISPDGNWLIYATSGYFPQILWKKPLSGDGEAVKLFENAGGPAHISADSQQIAVHSFVPNEEGTNIWRYVVMPFREGAVPTKIVNLDPERAIVRWKPDGSGFYFMNKDRDFNNIWFYPLADGKSKRVTNFDQLKIVNLSVSPDGKRFAAARGTTISEVIKISGF